MKSHIVTIKKIQGNRNGIYNVLIDGSIICEIDAKGKGVNRYMPSTVSKADVLKHRAIVNAKNVLDDRYNVYNGIDVAYKIEYTA